ncbi:MAG TPA: two-component regulator propeller domain-containing protein [Verrucomicrobiae bacterium]|nr:two-component regulator propeller domain-containing protein [Verrucomicrobiae bacterium]
MAGFQSSTIKVRPGFTGRACRMAFLLGGLIGLNLPAATPTAQSNPWFLFQSWETADGLPENSATAVAQAPDGYLWFGTFNGLVRFNGVGFTVFNPANTPELPSAGIVNLHLDQGGRLWVSTYEGLVVGDTQAAPRFERVEGWTGDYVRTFTERPGGGLLITSFDGKLFTTADVSLTELPSPPGAAAKGYLGGVDEAGYW